jgi:lipopolysaccharide transport system permease protein
VTETSTPPARTAEPAQDDLFAEEEEVEEAPEATEAVFVPWRPPFRESLQEAWGSRHLLPGLAQRGIPLYRGYALGRAWLFLRPAMQIFGFSLIFGGVFHAKGPSGIPYLVFLIFSMQGWNTFQRTFRSQVRGIQKFKSLAKGLKMPLMLIPMAGPGRGMVYLAVYWVFAIPILFYYLFTKHVFYLEAPPKLFVAFVGLALAIAWGWAAGLPFSLLASRWADFRYAIRYVTMLLMFMTPVIYPLETLHGTARMLAQVNPLTGVMTLIQYGFLNAGTPPLYAVAWSFLALPLVAALGLWIFNRYAVTWIALDPGRKGSPDEDDDDEAMM